MKEGHAPCLGEAYNIMKTGILFILAVFICSLTPQGLSNISLSSFFSRSDNLL